MRIDLVGVDFVRIDLVGAPLTMHAALCSCKTMVSLESNIGCFMNANELSVQWRSQDIAVARAQHGHTTRLYNFRAKCRS